MGTRTLLLILGLHFPLLGNLEARDCGLGFIAKGRTLCVDTDECKEFDSTPPCGSNATCFNTNGSFYCQCLPGFISTTTVNFTISGKCTEVNECKEKPQACGRHATCVNSIGSYNCRCHSGFSLSTSTGDCEDINECSNTKRNECLCASGYGRKGDGDCDEVNECQEKPQVCGRHATCVNSIGSYNCHCHSGFSLSTSTGDCEDLDECQETPQVCGSNASCLNTFGSFNCQCQPGFRFFNHTVKN